jgi:fluoride exporter
MPTPDHGDRQIVDPDVDLHDSGQRSETTPHEWDLLAAVVVGGILGAWARYGLSVALPHRPAAFPWSTVVINLSGCALIGMLMVVLLELTTPHRLARPFLGVGVLGGYTTFSTFAVDADRLLHAHRPLVALAYVVLTLLGGLVAVWLAGTMTRRVGRAVRNDAA